MLGTHWLLELQREAEKSSCLEGLWVIIVMSQLAVLMHEQDPGRQKTLGQPGVQQEASWSDLWAEFKEKEAGLWWESISGIAMARAPSTKQTVAMESEARTDFVLKQILILKMCMDMLWK